VERVNKVLIRHSPCSVRAEAWASRCRLCISIVIVENAVLFRVVYRTPRAVHVRHPDLRLLVVAAALDAIVSLTKARSYF
jgi:hypothetical protein